jgi:hypothetical protein
MALRPTKSGGDLLKSLQIKLPRLRGVSGGRISGTGCSWEGDKNCARSEGGVGEELYQRLGSSAQAGANVSYFGRNLGLSRLQTIK